MVQRQNLISIATTTALCIVLGGAAVFAIKTTNTSLENTKPQAIPANPKSQVIPLVGLSAKERALQLNAIAQLPQSIEHDRAI